MGIHSMTSQRKPLTPKEIKLVKGIAEGKTKRQAALDAYEVKTPETASSMASEALRKPNVQDALARAFEKYGITIDAAIAPIGKALTATKVVIHGNKEDAFAEVVDDIELQLKGHDRVMKLMGIGKDDTGGTQVINNFIMMSAEKKDKYGF